VAPSSCRSNPSWGFNLDSEDTLVSLFRTQIVDGARRAALRTKRGGAWESITWAEWGERSHAVAAALLARGIQAGDRVAIMAGTREEWLVADSGVNLAGAINVPVYHTLIGEQAAYVIEDSGARVLFAETAALARRVVQASPSIAAQLEWVVVFDGAATDAPAPLAAKTTTFARALEVGREELRDEAVHAALEARIASVKATDLATIMYTSGTTGHPKGVMLTHDNFAFITGAFNRLYKLGPYDEQLLFLPMAHIFAKALVAMQLRVGYVTSFAESLVKTMDNALEVEPTFMGAVPRLYEKIYAAANERASAEKPAKKKIFDWAVSVGRRVARAEEQGGRASPLLRAQHRVADKLVLSKIRARFGKRIRFVITGGAPLAKELMEWFFGAGMLVLEGYGLTETTAAATMGQPGACRFGSVGRPLPGVEVKIAPDGEVLIRGAHVMRGYWHNDDATRAVITEDGWFHSGDIGVVEPGGFLRITDRKKDIIVTAAGKNVAPQNIENLLKQSPWISQAMVHGDKRPYLVALVTLNAETAGRFAEETGKARDIAALATDPEVRARVASEVDAVNKKLSSFETVKRFRVLPGDFSIEGGELTPTLKVRRKIVTERHSGLLASLYADDTGA